MNRNLDFSDLIWTVKIQEIIKDELNIHDNVNSLMNRNRLGIPIRNTLRTRLFKEKVPDTVLVIDFTGIEESTSSVAEEIGPLFFRAFLQHRERIGSFYLAYGNLKAPLVEALDGAFLHLIKKENTNDPLTCVGLLTFQNEFFAGHYFFGRKLPDAIKEVLDMVYEYGSMTSTEMEERGVKAASRKLNEICSQYPWLIRRHQQRIKGTEKGWTFVYSPVVPLKERR